MGGRATSDNFGPSALMQRRRLGPKIRGGNRGEGHGEMGALKSAYRGKRAVPGTDMEIQNVKGGNLPAAAVVAVAGCGGLSDPECGISGHTATRW